MRCSLVALSLYGCLVADVHAAEPVDPAAALERARVCWAALDTDCAEAALTEARAGLAALPPEGRIEALRISAEVALSTERLADAHTHLLALLEIEPRFSPSTWPSPWNDALDSARKAAPDRLPPAIGVTLPAEVRPKRAIPIEVRVEDPSGVVRCELVLPSGLRLTLMTADGVMYRGEIPKEEVRVPEIFLRVEAADRVGNVGTWPADGRSHRLVVIAPPKQKTTPITATWWFWTAVGVVAVGGAVALTLALTAGDDAADPNSIGDLHLLVELP